MSEKENYLNIALQRSEEKKTHVSFPQLKYPSLRDGGLKHSAQWLEGKALDDGAEGLWRVHNSLYDLSSFLNSHPGGAEWLELTKGTDITEAFECHHLSDHVWDVLAKYFTREAKTPRNSPFTFEEDGFFRTLKRDAIEELKKIPADVKKRSDRIIDSLLFVCVVSSALAAWSSNFWLNMVFYLTASLSLGWMIIAAHNYIHRKTNWRMYLFNLGTWSYSDFRISHVLSHHLYPNTLMDFEVSAMEPFIWWNPRKEIAFIGKYAYITQFFLFPFVFIINFVKRFLSIFLTKDFFKRYIRWHDGVCFLLPLWMYLASGSTLAYTVYNWLWIVCTASFVFVATGSNAAHHHPDVFKDGDEVSTETIDWGLHEVASLMERHDINGNLFKVLTFFGDHSLHHIFPTVDHAALTYLYPVYLKNIEKFGANYRVVSQWDMIVGQLKQTFKSEPTLLKSSE